MEKTMENDMEAGICILHVTYDPLASPLGFHDLSSQAPDLAQIKGHAISR